MDKKEIKEYFDKMAADWDSLDETDADIVNVILDNANVRGDVRVLDVACGTGVMMPFYIERGVLQITGIDISPEMTGIAREKFAEHIESGRIRIFTGDIESVDEIPDFPCDEKFNRVVLYNAFPHFPDSKKIVNVLCGFLGEGGILTIAHGKCREKIDAHHKGHASHISNGLMSIEDLERLLPDGLEIINKVSDSKMYQIVAQRTR